MTASLMPWKARWPLLVVVSTFVQTTLFFWGLRVFFPHLWARQLGAGFTTNAMVFLATGIFLCFMEWGGHRYLLHTATISWLIQTLTFNHGKHHALTSIVLLDANPERTLKRVSSNYVLVEKKQYHSVVFADYFLVAIFAGYAPLFALLVWLFPAVPFLGGYVALAVWVTLYDVLHPFEHKPDEWWEKRKYNPLLSLLHRFHQYHHVNTNCNMAIVGFFGLPLADWLLGTFKLPPLALRDGDIVEIKTFAPPAPRWFVLGLDAWALKREQRLLGKQAEKNRRVMTTK